MLTLTPLTPEYFYKLLAKHNGSFKPYAEGIINFYKDKLEECPTCKNFVYFLASLVPENYDFKEGISSTGYGLLNNPTYKKCIKCNGLDTSCPNYTPSYDMANRKQLFHFLDAKLKVLKKYGSTQPKDVL